MARSYMKEEESKKNDGQPVELGTTDWLAYGVGM